MATDQFEALSNSYVVTAGNTLVAVASDYRVGAVAVVLPSKQLAEEFINIHREDIESLHCGTLGCSEVHDPWKLMRRAAGEGLAGIQSLDQSIPDAFMFMVRTEDAGSDLPTILATPSKDGNLDCLTRTSTSKLCHAEVLHWERYDILDRTCSRWGSMCPFRNWEHGDPLYELAGDGLVLIASVPLLGDWISPDGAFAFFSSEEQAIEYHNNYINNGRNRIMATRPQHSPEPRNLHISLKPIKVSNLASRLQELEGIWGTANWCINPTGHREDSGFGRLWESGEDQRYQLRTVAGNWGVGPCNQFEKTDEPLAWSGRDTLFWSGSQSIQLLPLDISFGTDPIREAEAATPMTEVEAEEWVKDYLSLSSLDDIIGRGVENHPLNSFFVSCWDSVTGDRYDPIPHFSGFMEAIQFLAAYERESDAQFRLDGAAACSAIGFVGSGDEAHEALRGERFQRGIINLGKRHLLHGYHPSYAADLVALANATLRTLHVDFAGYAKDILWALETEAEEELLEELGIETARWLNWRDGNEPLSSPRGRELVVSQIGETAWNRLTTKVQHFLSTALASLEHQGHAPQLDYAPISIEVVKGLEVELGYVLEGFRDSLEEKKLNYTDEDKALSAFIYDGGKTPTLGAISYFLRNPAADASDLRKALYEYLISLPNGAFLTSNRFAKRDLQKVINRYRNGGAHDSPISEEVCRSCIDALLGTTDNPGLISQVTNWRV